MVSFLMTTVDTGNYKDTGLLIKHRRPRRRVKQKGLIWLVGLLFGIGGISTAFGASGVSDSSNFRLVKPETLSVATSATPPSFIIKLDGTTTGIVPTILREFAAQHNLKIAFQTYSFSGMLTAVESGRADVGGAIYYTTQRAKAVLYVQPYGADGSFLLIKKSSPYSSVSSLKGKKVAVAAGYAQVPYVLKAVGDQNTIQVSSDQIGVETVKTGRAYGYVTGGEVSWYAHGDPTLRIIKFKAGELGQPASITSTTDNMFVDCGNEGLKKALDEYVNQLRSSGRLAELLKKYHEEDSILNTPAHRPNLCKQ